MTRPSAAGAQQVGTARSIVPILPTVQHYDWGSYRAIPELLGHRESTEPVAELWFGTHPSGASLVADASTTSLADLIAADPVDTLGSATLQRFGPHLPFLLKILAAEKPLSLQVHPSVSQARAGFADELSRCIPAGAPTRNYRDDNHKPELLCALTEFWALAGFRPVKGSVALLRDFGLLDCALFRGLNHPARDLRGAVEAILAGDRETVRAATATAWSAAHRIVSARSAWYNEARWFLRMAETAPDDPGLLIALLLNLVRLEPGQFIFVPAGQVHAYLYGTGVEIMASSDNVLRCGLTTKHVDSAELVRIADFSNSPVFIQNPVRSATGELVFNAPIEDFALSRFDVTLGQTIALNGVGPQIILCVNGTVTLSADGSRTQVSSGHATFVPAGQAVSMTGSGTAFRATTNVSA